MMSSLLIPKMARFKNLINLSKMIHISFISDMHFFKIKEDYSETKKRHKCFEGMKSSRKLKIVKFVSAILTTL